MSRMRIRDRGRRRLRTAGADAWRRGWWCWGVAPGDGRRVLVPTRATGRTEPALRIEQEHTGRDDLFTILQTRANLDAVGQLHADRDLPGLESIAGRDEDVLLQSRVDDGVPRDGEDVLSGRREISRAVESGPQRALGIDGGQPDAQRARALAERRVDEGDARR